MDEKPAVTIEELENLRRRSLSELSPEFLARIRRRGRELLAARGIALPPEE